MATQLIQTPRYYGPSILAQIKVTPVIFLLKETSTPPPV